MSEFVGFSFLLYDTWSINTDSTLIRARIELHRVTKQDPLDSHIYHACLNPRFLLVSLQQSDFPPIQVAPAQSEESSSSLQPCAATALQLPMHRTRDFTLQYTTAPTTCNEQFQYRSGRPAESCSIAPSTFTVYTPLVTAVIFFLSLSSQQYHYSVASNGSRWGFWFSGGNEIVNRNSRVDAVITATVYR